MTFVTFVGQKFLRSGKTADNVISSKCGATFWMSDVKKVCWLIGKPINVNLKPIVFFC